MDLFPRTRPSKSPEAARRAEGEARLVRLRPEGRPGAFSRETLAQWHRWTARPRFSVRDAASCLALAILAHAALGLVFLLRPNMPIDLDSVPKPVKVRFLEGRGKRDEAVQNGESLPPPPAPATKPKERAAPRGMPGKAEAPARAQARRPLTPSPTKPSVSVRTDGLAQGPAVPATAPQEEAAPTEKEALTTADTEAAPSPASQVAPPSLPKGLRRFLPGNNSAYTDRQRTIGNAIGSEAIGGDVPEPDATMDPKDRPVIVEREYSLAHYFDTLNRRFSDAWGPTRTLPPDSKFTGVVGEQIVYNIVINRDGTLRKIVNKTALAQPWRDFDDVDAIVREVFSNVFPLASVPNRILQDPVVLTKRIQYTGYTYSMF